MKVQNSFLTNAEILKNSHFSYKFLPIFFLKKSSGAGPGDRVCPPGGGQVPVGPPGPAAGLPGSHPRVQNHHSEERASCRHVAQHLGECQSLGLLLGTEAPVMTADVESSSVPF